MTFPLMPIPLMPIPSPRNSAVITSFVTTDTNDIEPGDLIILTQTKYSGSALNLISGFTSLNADSFFGSSFRTSFKIADVSDVGATYSYFANVLIARLSNGGAMNVSADVGSGAVSTSGYSKPLGVLYSTYINSGNPVIFGSVDGAGPDSSSSAQTTGFTPVSGVWNGNYFPDVVALTNGAGKNFRWRLIYAS